MKLLIFLTLIPTILSLNCTQIPDSEIYDGSSFYFPYNESTPTSVPANFNCIYTISAPITSSGDVLYGSVILHNLLGGYVDRIVVMDSMGRRRELTSDDDAWFWYEVFPGKPMTIQVITSSEFAASKFQLHVSYRKAKTGTTSKLKSGGNMNYVDLSTVGGDKATSSITILGKEQISVTLAMDTANWPQDYLDDAYIIDGDFFHQVNVFRLSLIAPSGQYITSSNNITIVKFQNTTYQDVALVFNRLSEVENLGSLSSTVSTPGKDSLVEVSGGDKKSAVQILDIESRKIKMKYLNFNGTIPSNCVAQVVTGPPNQNSQLLLDLTKSVDLMPYTFNLKYFSIYAQNCDFSFSLHSPSP